MLCGDNVNVCICYEHWSDDWSLVTVSAVENCCVKARDLGPQWAGGLDYSCDLDQASIGPGPGTAEIRALCETQISTL